MIFDKCIRAPQQTERLRTQGARTNPAASRRDPSARHSPAARAVGSPLTETLTMYDLLLAGVFASLALILTAFVVNAVAFHVRSARL